MTDDYLPPGWTPTPAPYRKYPLPRGGKDHHRIWAEAISTSTEAPFLAMYHTTRGEYVVLPYLFRELFFLLDIKTYPTAQEAYAAWVLSPKARGRELGVRPWYIRPRD